MYIYLGQYNWYIVSDLMPVRYYIQYELILISFLYGLVSPSPTYGFRLYRGFQGTNRQVVQNLKFQYAIVSKSCYGSNAP